MELEAAKMTRVLGFSNILANTYFWYHVFSFI